VPAARLLRVSFSGSPGELLGLGPRPCPALSPPRASPSSPYGRRLVAPVGSGRRRDAEPLDESRSRAALTLAHSAARHLVFETRDARWPFRGVSRSGVSLAQPVGSLLRGGSRCVALPR